MQVWIDRLFHLLEAVLVFLLSAMVVMVFGNVVLRYGFNKGINVSEELSRYFFVWLTFIGAVVTFRENAHLGVESVVRLLPRRGRIVCMLITNSIILLCAGIFFWGTWLQHDINASMVAPVVGISMIWVFGIGYFASIGIGLIALLRTLKILLGKVEDSEIATFSGEYEETVSVRKRPE